MDSELSCQPSKHKTAKWRHFGSQEWRSHRSHTDPFTWRQNDVMLWPTDDEWAVYKILLIYSLWRRIHCICISKRIQSNIFLNKKNIFHTRRDSSFFNTFCCVFEEAANMLLDHLLMGRSGGFVFPDGICKETNESRCYYTRTDWIS